MVHWASLHGQWASGSCTFLLPPELGLQARAAAYGFLHWFSGSAFSSWCLGSNILGTALFPVLHLHTSVYVTCSLRSVNRAYVISPFYSFFSLNLITESGNLHQTFIYPTWVVVGLARCNAQPWWSFLLGSLHCAMLQLKNISPVQIQATISYCFIQVKPAVLKDSKQTSKCR